MISDEKSGLVHETLQNFSWSGALNPHEGGKSTEANVKVRNKNRASLLSQVCPLSDSEKTTAS